MARSPRRRRTFQPGIESLTERITPTIYEPIAPLPLDPGLLAPNGGAQPSDSLINLNTPAVDPSQCLACQPTGIMMAD